MKFFFCDAFKEYLVFTTITDAVIWLHGWSTDLHIWIQTHSTACIVLGVDENTSNDDDDRYW